MSGFRGVVFESTADPFMAAPGVPPLGWRRYEGAGFVLDVAPRRVDALGDHADDRPAGFGRRGVCLVDGWFDDSARPAGLGDHGLLARTLEGRGRAAPVHLVGDFAIAAIDPEQHTLLLATDPMGRRTLYYMPQPGRLYFATTLKALLTLPGVPRDLDPAALAEFVVSNPNETLHTLYRGVLRLLPGHRLDYCNGRLNIEAFHHFDLDRRVRLSSDADYVEAGRAHLERAVAAAARTATPPALYGAGGLDSLLVAFAARRLGLPVRMLAMVPPVGVATVSARPGWDLRENERLDRLAADCPDFVIERCPRDVNGGDLAEPNALFQLCARPQRGAATIASIRALLQGADISLVLTGGVGNFTLSWNGARGLSDAFRDFRWGRLLYELVRLGRLNPRRTLGFFRREVLAPWLPFRPSEDEMGFLAREQRPAVRQRLASRRPGPADHGGPDSRAMRLLYIQGAMRNNGDMRSCWPEIFGVEYRAPLGDLALTEFCLAIPEDQYLRDGVQRWLARRILDSYGAPQELVYAPTRTEPHPDWFANLEGGRAALQGQLERIHRNANARKLLDLDALDQAMARWPDTAEAAERNRVAYEYYLPIAIHLGSFICWTEGSN